MPDQTPLISFVTHGRNDGYMGDFLWRLATCLNKIADGFAAAGRLHDVEILVGDWGSPLDPLCQVLNLTEQARTITRFCTVPQEVAARHNGDGVYSYPAAANVPIRRARGKFVFSMDSDAYMPAETAELLLKMADGEAPEGVDLNNTFFWLSRLHIPFGYLAENRSLDELDTFIREQPEKLVRTAKCNLNEFRGGAVAIFAKRELFHSIRGYNESLIYWGWADVDIHYRLALQFKALDLWDLGGVMYHLEHYPQRGKPVDDRKLNPQAIPAQAIVNGPDWGAANEAIEASSLSTRSPDSSRTPMNSLRTRNIVISGTNYWNPGDDFVRDGVIQILHQVFPGEQLNFLFYNFNADFFPQIKFAGISNFASCGDLDQYRDSIDAIIIAGLSAGTEIKDLYRWILSNRLQDRVYLIGAGYENGYVGQHIDQEPEATIFRNAKIIIGRTANRPAFIDECELPYVHLNCPALLSVPEVKPVVAGRKCERIGFSIQLPHGQGLVNHSCAASQFELAVQLLEELSEHYQVEVVAHHKTEYFYFLNRMRGRGIPVIFSSFYQDLFPVYPRYDLVVTTRLHASLFANGHGIPGIIINDTDRHTHTLEGFPHSVWVNTRDGFDQAFSTMSQWDLCSVAAEARAFKHGLLTKYVQMLQPLLCPARIMNFPIEPQNKEEALIRNVVKTGMTALDVGAAPGDITRLLSLLVQRQGKVFAFEPSCEVHASLVQQFHRENLSNVITRNQQVTNRNAEPTDSDPLQVSSITVDEFCKQAGLIEIDYLRLNLQGAEFQALEGARELLAAKAIKVLQIQSSKRTNADTRRLVDFLGEWGYACHAITDEGTIGRRMINASLPQESFVAIPAVQTGDTNLIGVTTMHGPSTSQPATAAQTEPGSGPRFSFSTQGTRNSQTFIDPSLQASPESNGAIGASLPIHFFTIVLNGKPFIDYHINVLRQLPFRWHWHIVEGVAELNHDTAWSRATGGKITGELHSNGFSNDGTTDYLNELASQYPDQITLYRKPAGSFWDGKLEMVNAPLRNIHEQCLLWQLDADELWTAEQLVFAQQLFTARPDKTAAYYYCHYFVGPDRIITTRDTYGNNTSYEWLRTWRFAPGCRWTAHEPPRLCQPTAEGQLVDLAGINPFLHKETEALDLVFQHYAYATEAQLRFKQDYYGYAGAVDQWRRLQGETRLPVRLAESFSWVKDGAIVNTAASQGVTPLIPAARLTSPPPVARPGAAARKRILFVRPDAIGDAVLAASMLAPIRQKYLGAEIAVLCQEHLAEFWAASPFVDTIIGFNKAKTLEDRGYKDALKAELRKWAPDLVLNSVFSSEASMEELTHTCETAERIGLRGDLSNISADDRLHSDSLYTRQIPSTGHKTELEHHRDFLKGLGISSPALQAQVWTTPDDDAVADAFFRAKGLDPARTIALFPGSQHAFKTYPHLASALKNLTGLKAIILGGIEVASAGDELAARLPFPAFNLAGKTTIREMASLIRKCRLYVGADSAGAHLACAVGTPNVVVLGGGHFGRFFPYSGHTSVVCLPLSCYGCNWRCSYPVHHCIEDLAPEVLSEAVQRTLRQPSARPRIFVQKSWSNSVPQWQSAKDWIRGNVEWIEVNPAATNSTCAKTAEAILPLSKGEGRPVLHSRSGEGGGEGEGTSCQPTIQPASLSQSAPSSLPTDPNLAEVEQNWNEFGKRDPLWAILTDEKCKNGKWNVSEFFSIGQREISGVMTYAEGLNHPFQKRKALDFGCGVGRLTQALCRHFEECHGVDIAASMIEQARSYNRFGACCHYHVNTALDLKLFASDTFDFIYSNIVLQHNRPENSRKFIAEFFRVLSPGGLLIFQIPSHPVGSQGTPGTRLQPEGFRAEITLADSRLQAAAGTSMDLKVQVKNVSAVSWSAFAGSNVNAIKLGNHWLDSASRTIVHDDGRVSLPSMLAPGQSIELPLSVTVPGKPGRYILELDMVQEHVSWFANQGSHSLRVEVEVHAPAEGVDVPATPSAASQPTVLVPRMEMHGIPKPQMLELLASLGATVLDVQDDQNATGWVGYRYCITKAPKPATASPAHRPLQPDDGLQQERRMSLPLPKGEGRGEGKGTSRQPTIPSPAEPITPARSVLECGPESSGPLLESQKAIELPSISPIAPSATIKVSAIVSTYNSERFIKACLDDLTNQTLFKAGGMEIIVIKSGSQQKEEAIVNDYQTRHPNIVYLRTERESLYASWNRGIEMARGAFIANANTDDSRRPDAFEKLAQALETNPGADLAYAHCAWTTVPNDTFGSGNEQRPIIYQPYHPALSAFYCFTGCLQFWRATSLRKLGGFDASLKAVGDYEILLRFAQAKMQAVLVPEILSLFYQNTQGITQQSSLSQQEEIAIRGKYRNSLDITTLFACDSTSAQALAWNSLGVLAAGCHVPWLAEPVVDYPFALACFQRAAQLAPSHPAVLQNLVVQFYKSGRGNETEPFLKKLPVPTSLSIQAALTREDHVYADTHAASAVPAPVQESSNPVQLIATAAGTRSISVPAQCATRLPVRWLGPIFNPSGYASEAINFILPLAERVDLGIFHHTNLYSENFVKGLARSERDTLFFLRDKFPKMAGGISISHNPASGMFNVRDAVYRIGRTMFETDRIAPEWVTACNQMDEIWVPSAFNVETFAQSGVERDKLFVMPEAVDEKEFDPARHEPLPLPNKARFNFLSIFEWSTRKGWDVLLSAYLQEFSAEDDVCLYLRTYLFSKPDGDPSEAIWKLIREHAARLDLGDKAWPRIHLIAEQIPQADLPRLYKAADCLVAPSRGEGWGRPHHEAMLMGLPVIATNWSGNTEFMNDENSFLIDYELVEAKYLEPELFHYRGHRWANPSESHLRKTMRQVVESPDLARQKGANARAHMLENYSRKAVADKVIARLQQIEHQLSTPSLSPCPAARVTSSTYAESPEPSPTRTDGVERNLSNGSSLSPRERAGVRGKETSENPGTLAGTDERTSGSQLTTHIPLKSSYKKQAPAQALPVAWEGTFLDFGSLSQVNRQLTEYLQHEPGIQLTCVGKNMLRPGLNNVPELQNVARRIKALAVRQTEITVRHAWPPRWEAPASGSWVLVQPWEFGALPQDWVQNLERVDEVWVPSEYVRRVYVDSGVHPDKVKIVPNGVEPKVFNPSVKPLPLATQKKFKFLFVGGTIRRKGPDVLLDAYLRSFTAGDDVCLVIKDFGGDTVYAGQTFEEQIRAAQAQPNAPEILYLTKELSPPEIAGLYTACDCLVHPYRGEGFGLPVLEAMACGLPVVVTGGGATDDFATDEFAYRIESKRQSVGLTVADMPLAHNGWWLEPSTEAVGQAMREIFENPAEAKAKGLRASEYARKNWTWERAASIAAERLRDLHTRKQAAQAEIRARRTKRTTAVALPPVARLGDLTQARGLYKDQQLLPAWNAALKAIKLRPFHPEAFLLMAEIAKAVNDVAKARACIDRVMAMAPKWKAARNFPRVFTPKAGGPRVALPELPPMGKRLSVCLITKNEEKFLGQCLESVRHLADQIIVMDTGSTDSTREIAARYQAEVYSFKWCDDFSAARNAALERATGDWVLVIDADEQLPLESLDLLRQEMAKPNLIAYRLPIVDVGNEEDGCSYVPRLFRNAPGLFFLGRVHEQVFSSVEVRRLEWGMDNCLGAATLLHYGYSKEVTVSRNKQARNLGLLERALEDLPNEPNLVMNYGLELVRCGYPKEGLDHYWDAYHLLAALPEAEVVPELRETLLTQLSTHLLNFEDFRSVTQVLQGPLAKNGGLSPSLHFTLGLALLELKQYSEASDQFQACLTKRDRPGLCPGNKEIRKAGPAHCLALCYKMLDQLPLAAQTFAAALAEDPQSKPLRFDYAMFLAETEKPVEGLKMLNSILAEQPDFIRAWLVGAQIALRQRDLHTFAEEWTGEAMKQFPDDPMVQLQRAEALLLSQQADAALPLLRKTASPAPRFVAARFLCEILAGSDYLIPPSQETAVSREFLKWYRHFLEVGASDLVLRLNQSFAIIKRSLPSAAAPLSEALEEAQKDVVG